MLDYGRIALDQMERGDIREADTTISRDFEPAYQAANDVLSVTQAAQAARIDDAASSAGRTENITRLLVTLLIPGAAIVIHQLIDDLTVERNSTLGRDFIQGGFTGALFSPTRGEDGGPGARRASGASTASERSTWKRRLRLSES